MPAFLLREICRVLIGRHVITVCRRSGTVVACLARDPVDHALKAQVVLDQAFPHNLCYGAVIKGTLLLFVSFLVVTSE